MSAPINQEINVNINALVKRIQDVREFVALIRSLREQRGSAPVIVDEKIAQSARASVTEVDRLEASIDELSASIQRLNDEPVGKLARSFSILASIATVLGHVKGSVEGIQTLLDLGSQLPGFTQKLSTATSAIGNLKQVTRQKIGAGITQAQNAVTGLVQKLPSLTSGGGAAAGIMGRIGIAGAGAAIGVGALAVAVGVLAGAVLALIAGAAVIGFLFNLAKGAADADSSIHDLSQELAVSAETLSTLKVATATTSTSFEEASQGVSKFNKLIGEAADGSKDAARDLKRLGVEPQEALKNSEAALAAVFKRIHELPTPYEKARAAQIAFGKSGANMVPVIDSVGGSLEKAKEKAKEFGHLLSTQAAQDADEFGDQIDELHLRVEGLTNSIGRALIPELLKLLRVFSHDMPGAGGAFQFVLTLIKTKVEELVNTVLLAIATIKTLAALPTALGVLITTGNLDNAFAVIKERFKQELSELLQIANTPAGGGRTTGKNFEFGGTEKTKKPGEPPSTFERELESRRAKAQADFDKEKDLLDRLGVVYQTALDDRKIATEDYYDALEGFRRRDLAAQLALNHELQKIERELREAKIKEIDADKDATREQKVARKTNVEHEFTAAITPLEQEFNRLVAAAGDLQREIERAETAALQSLDEQISALLARVDEANGRTAAAAAEAIDKEFRDELEKLTIEKGPDSPLVKLLKEFIQLQKDRARVKQIDEQLVPLRQQFEIDRLEIETKVSQEVISQREGKRQILDLERQYLQAHLENLKTQLAETTDARLQLEIKLKIANVENEIANLKEIDETARSINENLRAGLEDFFASIADGTKSIKEAFADLGRFILQMFARLAAQRLVEGLFGNLLGNESGQGGLGGILSGVFGGKKAAGDMMSARPGGQLIQVAEAGYDELVVTTDPRYAGRTSGLLGAFIRRTGIIPDVEQFAAGGFARRIGTSLSTTIPRLAAGAFVSASAAGPEVALAGISGNSGPSEFLIKQFNIYDPSHVHDAMRNDGGAAVFWNFIDHNATEIRQRLKVRS